MNFRLWRTPANQLCVLCWSSGWSPKPLVSVLDWTGSNVSTADEPEVVLQADGLFSVSVLVNVEAVDGNFTTVTSQCVPSRIQWACCYRSSFPPSAPRNKSVLCRVEVPQHLIREKMISITGKPAQPNRRSEG